jgi:hypothetical protein
LRLPAIRSILKVMGLWSETHSYECNGWAIHNSLDGGDLESFVDPKVQEFLSGRENTTTGRFPRSNQLACGTFEPIFVDSKALDF